MLIVSASTRVTKRQGVRGHVCARHLWEGQEIVVGTKRVPQPPAYKGETP